MRIFYKIFFSFLLFISCAEAQTLTPGLNSTIEEDKQWVNYLQAAGFVGGGIRDSLPILKSQLGLNQEQSDAVDDLLDTFQNFDLENRSAGKAEDIEYRSDGKVKRDQKNVDEANGKASKAYDETLENVRIVRGFLGNHDMDFREWFYEEGICEAQVSLANSKGKDFSPDALVVKTIQVIETLPDFKAFKKEKEKFINSEKKTTEYFSRWKLLVAERILFLLNRRDYPSSNAGFAEYQKRTQKILGRALRVAKDLNEIDSSSGK